MDKLITSIGNEMAIREKDWRAYQFDTLYFGGGTPSLLRSENFSFLMEALNKHFFMTSLQEFTIEANPDDITHENLKAWKEIGVNRLSIGVQSFDNEVLEWMNRSHKAEDSLKALERARGFGFEKFSMDLIYGLPEGKGGDFMKDLGRVDELGVNHISAYALTIEENTPLHKKIMTQSFPAPDENRAVNDFQKLQEWARENDWRHYELSNLSKKGAEGVHNSQYWSRKPYLGLGPSAHGFQEEKRYWNLANNPQYIKQIDLGILPEEKESLSLKDQLNEWVMTSLRLDTGLNLKNLNGYPTELVQEIIDSADELIRIGELERYKDSFGHLHVRVPLEKRFLTDGIASKLFLV